MKLLAAALVFFFLGYVYCVSGDSLLPEGHPIQTLFCLGLGLSVGLSSRFLFISDSK